MPCRNAAYDQLRVHNKWYAILWDICLADASFLVNHSIYELGFRYALCTYWNDFKLKFIYLVSQEQLVWCDPSSLFCDSVSAAEWSCTPHPCHYCESGVVLQELLLLWCKICSILVCASTHWNPSMARLLFAWCFLWLAGWQRLLQWPHHDIHSKCNSIHCHRCCDLCRHYYHWHLLWTVS